MNLLHIHHLGMLPSSLLDFLIMKLLISKILHNSSGCDICALLYYLIQGIFTRLCFVFINIHMYHMIYNIWGCDIWALFNYLIQGIPISFCFTFINIPVYHIFTFLHNFWGCDILGCYFSFFVWSRLVSVTFLLLSACSSFTLYSITMRNFYPIFY